MERFPELSPFFKACRAFYDEMICIFPYFCPYAESTREIREIFKSVQLFRNRPAGNAECAWQFQTSVRSQADKGDFLVICRDFFGSVQMIIFIIHSVFVLYFLVEIAMVKFTILHPAFKLFLYVFKWTFYLSFFKRPVAWACI